MVNSQNQFVFNEYMNFGSTINSLETNTIELIHKPDFLVLLYFVFVSIFLIRLFYQLFQLLKTINANEIINYKKFKLVLLNNSSSPFSFFNYIFIDKDDYGSIGSNELLLHEITHARQKHSFDVILLELVLVLQWFNPFIYRYRQAFKEIHEYLADSGVLQANYDKIAYQKLIIGQIEKSFDVRLASQFNYSLTKNRIKMMTRINSGKLTKLKGLLVLPLIAIMLMAFSNNTTNKSILRAKHFQLKTDSSTIPSIFPVKMGDGVEVSSGFGMRIHPISKKETMHYGVDFKAPEGTPVYVTADGMVRKVEKDFKQGEGYGKYIIIDHANGFSTLYAQLSDYNVVEGKEVKQGDVIGYVGQSGLSTGTHLHYEVMKEGKNVNPADYFIKWALARSTERR
ncbi:MAG: hypothetical protein A2X13_03030 [Bacteroidetes bacterium GWC2_33_15]|nr:MAG: hypothetical protein A2X10_09565 [Bacteroidetes bacterium GWA2_33_15]OFX49520.1 MAG: hypothetical protein A2X13_03030 [Bacteroidetes bacterium GWC2_33_15]OFX63641.1 MAG: hypothetical protein A2X15_01195 [Bacteroidetes bacterium GWB2_32_14]OFX68855.1 MAG: hypothetical protein A2X14_13190 [Bacteroidetes bacterium GWD2_33_33]